MLPAPHLKVVVGRALGAVLVTLHGELSTATAGRLGDVLLDLIDGQGNLFVVIDLHDTVIPEGEGLDVLVTARASLLQRGGRFLLAAPSGGTGDVLQAAGLADAIETHPERRHHPSMTRALPREESAFGTADRHRLP